MKQSTFNALRLGSIVYVSSLLYPARVTSIRRDVRGNARDVSVTMWNEHLSRRETFVVRRDEVRR